MIDKIVIMELSKVFSMEIENADGPLKKLWEQAKIEDKTALDALGKEKFQAGMSIDKIFCHFIKYSNHPINLQVVLLVEH